MRLWSLHPKSEEEKKRYFAGLIDGEGSFSIKRIQPTEANNQVTPRYYISFAISVLQRKPIKKLANFFGLPHRQAGSGLWICECNDNQAYEVIKIIKDYLMIKRSEAEICYEFYTWKLSLDYEDKYERKEFEREYYHNKAQRLVTDTGVSYQSSEYYLEKAHRYYQKIKEVRGT